MLIGDKRIVDGKVRLYDVDGSFIEITIEDAFQLYEWLAKNQGRLLEEMRLRIRAERKQWQEP